MPNTPILELDVITINFHKNKIIKKQINYDIKF